MSSINLTTGSAKPKEEQSSSVKAYLFFYNIIQFCGWAFGLLQTLQYLLTSSTPTDYSKLWAISSNTITIFQTVQLMEVLHAAIRFVPSNPFQTFVQILSRLVLVWGILIPVPEARYSVGVPMLLICWCIAECTRYFYYAFHIYNMVPFISTWLRYSLFIILYPLGVSGELLTTYSSLSHINKRKLWSLLMPNTFNMAFHYDFILILFMLSYLHFFPQLYLYMIAQRKKFLGSKSH